MLFNPTEYTTIFLSYDEPNAETNYKHLLTLNPNSLRVHGVKGSDTAHKEVAKLSATDNVIIVDADNVVNYNFFHNKIELPETYDPKTNVLSFSAYNSVNSNCYGNGGIKVWPVKLLQEMRTHENGIGVDFDLSTYVELDVIASEIEFGSEYQAWRAGFREGVKLLLENNKMIPLDKIDYRNFDRLWMWSHVGSDVKFGEYAIYGCRQAMYFMIVQNFDHNQITDFSHLEDFYTGKVSDSNRLFNLLRIKTNNWFFGDVLSIEDSQRYKLYYKNPSRTLSNDTDEFTTWANSFKECCKNFDENRTIMLCTTGRDTQYGNKRIEGAKLGLEYGKENIHSYKNLAKIYDYSWLREMYDKK